MSLTLKELQLIKDVLEEESPLEIICPCESCSKKKQEKRDAKEIVERQIKLKTMDVVKG